MLITRCAWHPGYHGHPAFIGITDWSGLRLGFTDGICSRCAAQLTADLPGAAPAGEGAERDILGWMPGVGLVVIAVMATVLLVARPTHESTDARQMAGTVPTEPPGHGDPAGASVARPGPRAAGARRSVPGADQRDGGSPARLHRPGRTRSGPLQPSQAP